jgi:NADPH-dependent 2,4-dienoyl-CoA reductase/sulfur reductase-like enzyme
MQEHLIIIGGVAAGTKAAAKARRERPDLKITLYTEGKHISYSACGMPYFIEDVIKDENRLIVRTPGHFQEKENVDVFILHKVIKILPEEHKVQVENLETGERFFDEYTKLLIATGSKTIIPPFEGVELENVFVLKEIEDAVKIKNAIKQAQKVIIVGGGYIGLELLEALSPYNVDITLVECTPQILNTFDADMASQLENYIKEEKNLKIITDDGIKRLIGGSNGYIKQIETFSGKTLDADFVILALGIRPNAELAREAGIEIGFAGAIKVNEFMQTNISDIYAAGDCAETTNIVTGKKTWIPLGSTANKMGRVAAINITGGSEAFKGVAGSMVAKVFDYTVSKTGLNEKEAQEEGYNYVVTTLKHKDRSGYMPYAKEITLKMIAEKGTGKLLGLQAIGKGDADKRVNAFAVALAANMTVEDFTAIDFTYAPPYASAIDPLLVSAQQLVEKV